MIINDNLLTDRQTGIIWSRNRTLDVYKGVLIVLVVLRHVLQYVTHMCVNNLMKMGQGFFTAAGFGNFICSLVLTVMFKTIIIATFKTIPAADFIFYGKRAKR